MSAKKVYDLAVVVGQYQDGGQTKNRYQTIGAVMAKDDGGKFILMERSFNPAGVPHDPAKGNSIIVSMFEPKGQDHSSGSQRAEAPAKPQQAQGDFQDDIPF